MNAIKVVYKKHPILILFIAFIVLPLVCTLTIFWSLALETLPGDDYAFLSPKVKADVSISRDRHGVAYIDAIWDEDAFFGVGYVHAQDRLWQLELIRRMSRESLAKCWARVHLG
ncbi:penicillin acylase family protein [Teredinibacter turnerae]